MRGRLRDMYLSGNRAAADALLEREQRVFDARERPVRAPAVAPVLPGGMRVTEPPFKVGCFHCGYRDFPRHSCAPPRLAPGQCGAVQLSLLIHARIRARAALRLFPELPCVAACSMASVSLPYSLYLGGQQHLRL